jgi:poly(hydroxyalkanoate) depolymerase family esterase
LPIASSKEHVLNTNNMQQTMRDAMKLMRGGDLSAATMAIQQGLEESRTDNRLPTEHAIASGRSLDGEFHVATETAESIVADRDEARPEAAVTQSLHTGTFTCANGARDYLVYAPGEHGLQPSPLILMLHGCTQDAADFARGTRMHRRAAAEGYVVVYPTQCRGGNSGGCWNWFRPGDQQRDKGEPAFLAELVSEMTQRFNCDPRRRYVAGLSAGGAMAIVLGRTYPDVFRAVGAHSGLAYGAAHDVPSALSAMRSGAARRFPDIEGVRKSTFVPTIVFHGDQDRTVDVSNAKQIIEDATQAWASNRATNAEDRSDAATTESVARGPGHTNASIHDASGKTLLESWVVHGGGHAWFGGEGTGTYTDPTGPDATAEMLRFFRNAD